MADISRGSEEWLRSKLKSKRDLIVLLNDKHEALKAAVALGFCECRKKCALPMCDGLISLEERAPTRNLWWRCRRRSCRRYFSTLDGTVFERFRTKRGWGDILIVMWETSYDARVTSASIARVRQFYVE